MIAFIANQAVDLPSKFSEGDVIDDIAANVLQREFIKRLASQIRWRYGRGEIATANLQAMATAMAYAFEFSGAPTDDDDDPITSEAIILAKELITAQLAAEGITAMPNLDVHAKTLAENSPELRAQALSRIEQRYRIGSEAIAKLEI